MERTLTTKQEEALRPSFAQNMCKDILLRQLTYLRYGELRLTFNGEERCYGKRYEDFDISVSLDVLHPDFFGRVIFGGTNGAGESYMDGEWETDDLAGLVRLLVRNRDIMNTMDSGIGWGILKRPLWKMLHLFNRNTRKGSRRNISAHYDLGNNFFEHFLDPTMMYSSAFYPREDADLNEAAVAKLDRICQKLALKPDDHLVEIGTGWGGFAIHAATHYGCRVTTTTISREQHDYAAAMVRASGLEDRVEVLFKDYRDLEGRYDKLVSIEMIEAVGHQYLSTYLNKCSSLLKDDGVMLIQAITINDWLYDKALRSVDFIKRHIFPGSFIPSISAITDSMKQATNLRLFHLEDITPHYAKTLNHWRDGFQRNLGRIRAMGYSDAFLRMWDYYFCYCEGGFAERSIGSVQLVFTKPLSRRDPIAPVLA